MVIYNLKILLNSKLNGLRFELEDSKTISEGIIKNGNLNAIRQNEGLGPKIKERLTN